MAIPFLQAEIQTRNLSLFRGLSMDPRVRALVVDVEVANILNLIFNNDMKGSLPAPEPDEEELAKRIGSVILALVLLAQSLGIYGLEPGIEAALKDLQNQLILSTP